MKKHLELGLLFSVSFVAASAASCSSDPSVSIGDPVASTLADYAASWDGYAEGYRFEDGSDRVRLVVDGSGQGTLRFGNKATVPAATDPNVAYPPGLQVGDVLNAVHAGVEYPILGTRVEDSRIRLGVDPNELYTGWCAMQTPIADRTGTEYRCVQNEGYVQRDTGCTQIDSATSQAVPIDCAKLVLCLGDFCRCTQTGCAAITTPDAPSVLLDGALDNGRMELVGTLVFAGQRVTVRMHR